VSTISIASPPTGWRLWAKIEPLFGHGSVPPTGIEALGPMVKGAERLVGLAVPAAVAGPGIAGSNPGPRSASMPASWQVSGLRMRDLEAGKFRRAVRLPEGRCTRPQRGLYRSRQPRGTSWRCRLHGCHGVQIVRSPVSMSSWRRLGSIARASLG